MLVARVAPWAPVVSSAEVFMADLKNPPVAINSVPASRRQDAPTRSTTSLPLEPLAQLAAISTTFVHLGMPELRMRVAEAEAISDRRCARARPSRGSRAA